MHFKFNYWRKESKLLIKHLNFAIIRWLEYNTAPPRMINLLEEVIIIHVLFEVTASDNLDKLPTGAVLAGVDR
jgi:hypothetical protein